MLNRSLLATALLALASFSSASNATPSAAPTCTVGQYCIDFESDNYYAHSSDQDAQVSGDWSQVIDDEYVNAFDGISVQFWTSDDTSDEASGAPTVFPTTTGQPNYDKLITHASDGAAPYLVLFDTHATNTKDDDLEVGTSNIAIIYEEDNSYSECKDVAGEKICKDPDDRYQSSSDPHGGFVFVHFSEPVHVHAIDLIDIEDNANQKGSFGFYDNTTNLIDDTNKTMVAMQYDSGAMTNGNHGTQTFSTDYSSLSITTLVIRMQGSGGFDNIAFSRVNEVPEPSSLALFTLGLLGLTRLKKKADKS